VDRLNGSRLPEEPHKVPSTIFSVVKSLICAAYKVFRLRGVIRKRRKAKAHRNGDFMCWVILNLPSGTLCHGETLRHRMRSLPAFAATFPDLTGMLTFRKIACFTS
jgi:hypothetical protein